MLVDGNFDAVVVAGSAFAERAGAAHKYAAAVAQFAVEGLDYARTGLANMVSRRWQHLRVGAPSVGKVVRVAAVAAGQRPPEPLQPRGAAAAQHPRHHAPTGALHGQPAPHFALLAPHKRPHFIEFQRLPVPALRFFRSPSGQRRGRLLRFFLPAWQSCYGPRPWPGQCYATSCVPIGTGLPVRTAGLFPPPPARNNLGDRRLYIDT